MVSPLRGGAHPLAQPAAELVKNSKKLVNLRFSARSVMMSEKPLEKTERST